MNLPGVLEPIFASAVGGRVTPGGVVAIAEEGEVVSVCPFGLTASEKEGGRTVEADTVYDLASLTKPMVTAALAMQAVSSHALELSTHAANFDQWLDRPGARAIEIRHLLGHASGFPPHVRFFETIFRARSSRPAKTQLLALARDVELNDRPGEKAVYSDVGYIVLGALLERILGAELDVLFDTQIGAPLGRPSLTYQLGDLVKDASIAPTERAPDRNRELLCGVVHDENARAGIGPFGHAGLFGTAPDVLAFAVDFNSAVRGESSKLFDTGVAREFVTMSAATETTWRLGWDTPSPPPANSHAGDKWSRDGFGHLGYTGTSLWLDPARARAVVILTNRVYYSRDPKPIRSFRRAIMDAVVDALDSD